MAEINVGFRANANDLKKEIEAVIANLKKLELEQKDLSKSFAKGEISAEKYEQSLKSLKKSSGQYQSALGGLTGGSKKLGKEIKVNALPATQEFSRVIQDAPFGIQGVGNNLQQLTANFGNLSKNAGGSKKAIQAMISSLAGPAGMLLAVSVVTSLLTVFSKEIADLISGNNKLAASQKEVAKALNEFYGTQVTKISTYVSILEDVNTAEGDREKVIKKLIKLVPALTEEDFKYGKNLDIVREKIGRYVLAEAAKVEAQKLSEENSEKLGDLALAKEAKNIKDRTTQIAKFKKILEDQGKATTFFVNTAVQGGTGGLTTSVKELVSGDEAILKLFNDYYKELESDLAPLQQRIQDLFFTTLSGGDKAIGAFDALKKRQAELRADLENSIVTTGEQSVQTIDLKKQYDALSESIKKVNDALADEKGGDKDKRIKIKTEIDLETAEEQFKRLGSEFKAFQKTYGIEKFGANLIDNEKADAEIKRFIQSYQGIPEAFKEITVKASDTALIFADAIGNAFSALGQQIAQTFATGNAVIDTFVGTIVQSLANIGAALLESLITEKVIGIGKNQINRSVSSGNAVTIATSQAAALGPLGFAALPGLLATTQALVQGAFAATGSFAKGGFSGDDNLAFLNKNELVLRPFEQAALFNALRGTGMNQVRNNVTQNDGIVGEVVLRGQNQVIQLRRAEKKMNRFYNS